MHRLSLPALCGLSLLALSAVTFAGGTKLKPAATPEEIVANIEAAARAGDLSGFLAQIAPPVRQVMELELKVAQGEEAFEAALNEKFGKDPSSPPPPSVTEELKKHFPKLEIRAKDVRGADSVILTLWSHETRLRFSVDKDGKDREEEYRQISEVRWPAVRQDGSWKVVPNMSPFGKVEKVKRQGADGKEVEVEVRTLTAEDEKRDAQRQEYTMSVGPKVVAASEKVLGQVKGGAFKTREEARKAIRDAEEAIRKEFPPPWMKMEEKKDSSKGMN